MCSLNEINKIIWIIYLVLCFIIPIIYLIFKKHYKNKKNIIISFIILILMLLIKFSFNGICDYIAINSNSHPNAKNYYEKLPEIEGDKKDLGTTSKGYEIYTIDDVTYIDGYLVVNKTYGLSEDYVPTDTSTSCKGISTTCNSCINNDVYSAWKDMQKDAALLGLDLKITSGYRPYVKQESLYNKYVERDGKEKADTYSARAGHSEHQTSLCFDLNSISDAFANTAEGKWIAKNAYLYGFILRYPEGKTNETGYKYESWHLRYVGTDLSYKLYNNGDWITMEDFFGITSTYQN